MWVDGMWTRSGSEVLYVKSMASGRKRALGIPLGKSKTENEGAIVNKHRYLRVLGMGGWTQPEPDQRTGKRGARAGEPAKRCPSRHLGLLVARG